MFGTRSPFAGKPRTIRRQAADGSPVFKVYPRELTPLRARIADTLAKTGTWAGMLTAMWATAHTPEADGGLWLTAIVGPWVIYPLTKATLRQEFKKRRAIVLRVGSVHVRRWFGWRCFDRNLPHGFRLLPHDKAAQEHFDLELKERKAGLRGQLIRKTRYYGESFHLSFDYLGQRNDIAVVFGRKEAQRLRDRLEACDAVLREWVHQGDGVPLGADDRPDDPQPGDLPEF